MILTALFIFLDDLVHMHSHEKKNQWEHQQSLHTSIFKSLENKLMVTKGEEGWGGMDGEFGIRRCKLAYILIEWVNNKLLQQTPLNILW